VSYLYGRNQHHHLLTSPKAGNMSHRAGFLFALFSEFFCYLCCYCSPGPQSFAVVGQPMRPDLLMLLRIGCLKTIPLDASS
jgi:hypothetical protein